MTTTPPTTATLAHWLNSQLDADEAAARAAASEGRAVLGTHGMGLTAWDRFEDRHDPARVLAQVAAVRRVMELHQRRSWSMPPQQGRQVLYTDDRCSCGSASNPCPTLRALASMYAGADGWRSEWAL
jgi:hypothetical protein